MVTPSGFDVSFSVSAIGSPPLSYQWQFNSNNIAGTADTLFLTNLALADFGAYRVLVSNPSGSVTSSNALLQLDSDHDGMADSWETNYFTSITNRTGFEDYDGDGVSDRDEFLEGTHPRFASSSVNPRLTIISDRGEVFVTPNIPLLTNGQTITLTGVPDPGLQFIGYLGTPFGGGPYYNLRTNPAPMRFGTAGIVGSQIVRAIFGLSITNSLDVTNGWRIDQAGWFGQTNVTHDGVDAVQSERILGTEQAWLELTNVMSGEGTITFWWKVDTTPPSELRFVLNNTPRSGGIGTNTDWQSRTSYLPAGANIIRWIYDNNDNNVSEYNGLIYAPADAGWVDEVTFEVWADPARDANSNGLADLWEYRYFDTLGVDPAADPDRDGVSNLDEFLDRTDPTSNASLLPRLTVSASGGSVTRNPDLPKYTLGQTVQLQAVPDPNNYFVTWAGAVSGTNTTNSVLMNRNQSITAIFGLPLPVALDTPGLVWTRGGTIGWYGQTNESHDSLHAAQSGPVGFHQDSWMDTTVTGPGTLVFWWKVSSQTNNNYSRFLIDGTGAAPGRFQARSIGRRRFITCRVATTLALGLLEQHCHGVAHQRRLGGSSAFHRGDDGAGDSTAADKRHRLAGLECRVQCRCRRHTTNLLSMVLRPDESGSFRCGPYPYAFRGLTSPGWQLLRHHQQFRGNHQHHTGHADRPAGTSRE